jgi:hypothetical protein
MTLCSRSVRLLVFAVLFVIALVAIRIIDGHAMRRRGRRLPPATSIVERPASSTVEREVRSVRDVP